MSKLCINKALYHIALALSLLSLSNTIIASPTSKEYVDKQIQEALEKIQVQLNQQNTRIETQITGLKHHIGEVYQGGIVFWVNESQQHGLIAAKIDATIPSGIQWRNGESGDKTTNARANGVFSGLSNTQLIISAQTIDDQEGQFAALVAHQFAVLEDGVHACDKTLTCYGNWYLPSLQELKLMRNNLYLQGVGQWTLGSYWSSSEEQVSNAYLLDFGSGEIISADKAVEALVRPIHAF